MIRRRARVLACVAVAGLVGSLGLVAPAGATRNSQQQGVTDDEIEIVAMVADLDGLRSKGLISQPKLTTGNLLKRWQAYADAYGPINGRKVVIKSAVWDPIDPTTFDKACASATQDNQPLVVVNGNGYRSSSIPCITVDNQTPMIVGDPTYSDMIDASEGRLFGLLPPSDVAGKATADYVAQQKLVPKTAKIGVLGSNEPGQKAGSDALVAQLKKNGYDVVSVVESNVLSGDTALQNRESAAAVGTFQAAGVDTVFIGNPFTSTQGYFQEAQRSGADFDTYVVDVASSMCTPFSAGRIPGEAAGIPCLTASDGRAVPTKDAVKKDNAAEVKCRAEFDKAFAATSQPGVPSGDVVANGVTYSEDFAANECQIMNLLLPALKKAGKNPTWAKIQKNLEKTSGPAIYMSDGEGSYGKDKHYFADNIHLVVLNQANAQTAPDANGLFNGCPAPVNCWVPQVVDGQEWVAIKN